MTPSQALGRFLHVVIKVRIRQQEKSIQEILLHYAFTLSPFVEATAPGICTVQFTDHRHLQAKVVRVIEQLTECEISSQAGIALRRTTTQFFFTTFKKNNPFINVKQFLAPCP
jgi:hypothetical protein